MCGRTAKASAAETCTANTRSECTLARFMYAEHTFPLLPIYCFPLARHSPRFSAHWSVPCAARLVVLVLSLFERVSNVITHHCDLPQRCLKRLRRRDICAREDLTVRPRAMMCLSSDGRCTESRAPCEGTRQQVAAPTASAAQKAIPDRR